MNGDIIFVLVSILMKNLQNQIGQRHFFFNRADIFSPDPGDEGWGHHVKKCGGLMFPANTYALVTEKMAALW
jgi:hypothetical protein